jgi:hypothetical protein
MVQAAAVVDQKDTHLVHMVVLVADMALLV